MSKVFLAHCKQPLLLKARTFVPRQHQPNSDRMFLKPLRPGFFLLVLSSRLQIDTNLCISSMTYLSSNQQSTNGEHSEQLFDYQTQMFDNRTTRHLSRNVLKSYEGL